MRRAVALAVALLTPLLATGCSLSSDPAADSLGRGGAAKSSPTGDEVGFGPRVDDALTIKFFAPAETVYEVTGPTTVKPGLVNISLTSEGNHNLALAGPGLPVALLWGALAGKTETDLTHSVRLRLGTYTYYCSVPGHRSAGMQGTIEVNAFGISVPTASSLAPPAV